MGRRDVRARRSGKKQGERSRKWNAIETATGIILVTLIAFAADRAIVRFVTYGLGNSEKSYKTSFTVMSTLILVTLLLICITDGGLIESIEADPNTVVIGQRSGR